MSSGNSSEPESEHESEGEQSPKRVEYSTFLRLMKLILNHRSVALQGSLMILLGTFTTLLEPRIFGYAIDEGILPKKWDRLQWIGLLFFLSTCVRVFSTQRQGYYFEVLGQKVTQDLRIKLFSHLQSLPLSIFDKNPAGRLLTRVTNDIAALSEMFSAGFVSMVCNILTVAGILVWLFLLDLNLGLIAASVFPILFGFTVYFSIQLKTAYREVRNRLSSLNAFLAENFSGMKVIHLFNRQSLHLKRFDKLNNRYCDAQVDSIRIFAFFQPLITIASGISVALVIWFGGVEAWNGTLKLGVLVAYFSYILSLFQPLREIADKWNVFLSGMTSAERIFSILDWEAEVPETRVQNVARKISNLKGHLVFENVWFGYDPEKNWVIKDFSLEIKPGEKVGIVGHTGAGKSSLISLLVRFYHPQKGRILLDGKDLRDYDLRELRASIGVVQQDPFLFSGSFQDNVTFWQEDEYERMNPVLSSVRFSREKSDLNLHERGVNLSMGERQVLAFARVALTEPAIWVLDEATANMDSEREHLVQKALAQASSNRTSIFIAHRLATVRPVDRIVVLHRGTLVEMGNHDALMKLGGLYARLYRYQMSEEACQIQKV